MINEDKKVMGFMALNDYPNVKGVDPADWETWIRNMFQLVQKTYFTLTCPGFLGMIHPIGLSQNPHCHARDRAVGFLEEIF